MNCKEFKIKAYVADKSYTQQYKDESTVFSDRISIKQELELLLSSGELNEEQTKYIQLTLENFGRFNNIVMCSDGSGRSCVLKLLDGWATFVIKDENNNNVSSLYWDESIVNQFEFIIENCETLFIHINLGHKITSGIMPPL